MITDSYDLWKTDSDAPEDHPEWEGYDQWLSEHYPDDEPPHAWAEYLHEKGW